MNDNTSLVPVDGRLCPHWERIDEDLFETLFSEVAKVRADNPDLFRFTHRRITVFEKFTNGDPEIPEEEILSLFTDDRPRNLVTVIDGNVGTGKSELCAYLSLELKDRGRNVLHIDKSANLLRIMAEEIPKFYGRVTEGKTLEWTERLEKLENHVKNHQGWVAKWITSAAILKIADLESSRIHHTDEQEDALIEFIENEIATLAEGSTSPTRIEFVAEEDLGMYDFLDVFDGVDNQQAASNWNEAIWEAIRKEYETPTMDELLERVARDLDERPVLVFEDFSVSALDAERLQRYIEEDTGENAWDMIIAGTQETIRTLQTNTAKDREWIRFYRTNKRDSSHVLFLDESNVVDFVRPFVGYPKSLDGSVSYQRHEDQRIEKITAPNEGSLCAECQYCDDNFRDLFPFNPTFIRRVYEGLPDEDQRPRKIIQKVSDVLWDYYHDIVDVPASSDEIDGLQSQITLGEDVYENKPLRRLAQWYGVERVANGHEEVILDRRFTRAFGVDDMDAFEEYDVSVDSVDETDVVIFPLTEGSGGGGGGGGGGGTGQKDKIKERYDEVRKHLDTWQTNPTKPIASDVDVYIKRGLTDAISKLTSGFEVLPEGELEYLVGGDAQPFVFSNGEPAEEFQIEINAQEFRQSDLLKLLRFGITREMKPRSADYDELFDRMGPQLIGYATGWQDHVQRTFLTPDHFYGVHDQHRTFEQFVAGAYGTLAVLANPAMEVTGTNLAEIYVSDEDLTISETADAELDNGAKVEDYERISGLFDSAVHIDALFGDLFAISDSIVDVPAVNAALGEEHPFDIGRALTQNSLNDLTADVRFDTSTNLADVGLGVYRAVQAFDNLPSEKEASAAPPFVQEELAGVDMENVRYLAEKLATYSNVDPVVKENLTQFSRLSNQEVERLVEASSRYESLNEKGSKSFHQQAHLLGLSVLGHEATKLLIGIDLEGTGGASSSTNFMEVSEDYVNQ